jgi:hypothetical protein
MTLFTPDTQLGDSPIDIEKLNLPPTRAEFVQFQRIARRAKLSYYIGLGVPLLLLLRLPRVGVQQLVAFLGLSVVTLGCAAMFVWGSCICPRCGCRVRGTPTPPPPMTPRWRRRPLPSNWFQAMKAIGPPRLSDFFTFRRCMSCLTRLNWSEADIRER